MENKYIIQAFQEALADLPPEEQVLKVLQFTKRMQELEAADLRRNAHSGVSQGTEGPVGPGMHGASDEVKNGRRSGGVQRSPEDPAEPIRSKIPSGAGSRSRSGSNFPPGWEGVGEQEADMDYDRGRNRRRSGGNRLQEDTSKKVNLPVLIGICAGVLCLIAVITVLVFVLGAGGGKTDEPNGSGELESGDVGPIETEGENTDDPGASFTPDGGGTDQEPGSTPGGGTDQEPGNTPGGGTDQEPGSTPGGGTDQEPGSTPGGGTDQEPGSTPGSGTDQEPGNTPGGGTDQGPDNTPGGGTDQEPGSTPGSGTDQEPGNTPGGGIDQGPDNTPDGGTDQEPGSTPGGGTDQEPAGTPGGDGETD